MNDIFNKKRIDRSCTDSRSISFNFSNLNSQIVKLGLHSSKECIDNWFLKWKKWKKWWSWRLIYLKKTYVQLFHRLSTLLGIYNNLIIQEQLDMPRTSSRVLRSIIPLYSLLLYETLQDGKQKLRTWNGQPRQKRE